MPWCRRRLCRPRGRGRENDSSGDETDAGDDDASESVDGANWEPAADERIRDHRTAQLEVRVVDGDGDPVDGAEVAVEMREHEFGFGTAVNATTLLEETEEGDEYREYIPELFNKAVLENGHKWRFWEDERELADGATEWLLEQGCGCADTPACGRTSTAGRSRRTSSRRWESSGKKAV